MAVIVHAYPQRCGSPSNLQNKNKGMKQKIARAVNEMEASGKYTVIRKLNNEIVIGRSSTAATPNIAITQNKYPSKCYFGGRHQCE